MMSEEKKQRKEETKRRKLGRGLSSLLGGEREDFSELDKVRSYKMIPIEFLHPGRYQPRQQMNPEDLEDLAHSIEEKGVLMPLLVRRHPETPDQYEIIAGERRWRAAQRAKLHEVPIIIKDLSDQETLEVALIENLQRQDLSPLEEAAGYRRLMDEFSHTQEQLAESVGKSRPHVANTMRLLSLPEEVKKLLESGALSAGHARALLGAGDPKALAQSVVKKGLNVRQTERLVKGASLKEEGKKPSPSDPSKRGKTHTKDADTVALERDLTNLLGLKVEISFKGDAGALTVHYTSLEQLDDILARLSHGAHACDRTASSESGPPPNINLETDQELTSPEKHNNPYHNQDPSPSGESEDRSGNLEVEEQTEGENSTGTEDEAVLTDDLSPPNLAPTDIPERHEGPDVGLCDDGEIPDEDIAKEDAAEDTDRFETFNEEELDEEDGADAIASAMAEDILNAIPPENDTEDKTADLPSAEGADKED